MIGEGPSLIEILPPRLKEALDQELHADEQLVLAARGRPREALTAIASRLLTLREGPTLLEPVAAEAYPLAEVTGIELREHAAGPALTWSIRGRPEPVGFDVPAYEVGKFRRAAEVLGALLPDPAGGTAGGRSDTAGTTAARCPKCGASLPDNAAFCPACGLQTRDICWDCGRPLETEWRFCAFCGSENSELGVILCPSCRQPVSHGQAYCPWCGAEARPTCDECDRILRRSWKHCPDCGAAAPGEVAAGGWEADTAPPQPSPARPGDRRAASTPFPEPGDVRPTTSSVAAEALNQQGIEAYEREQFDRAIDLFRRALALDPDNDTFHCNLAVACGEKGLDEDAFAEYQRTLALNPANVTALVNLGYLYSEQERYEEARDCWERAIRAAPDSAEAGEARENLQSLEQL